MKPVRADENLGRGEAAGGTPVSRHVIPHKPRRGGRCARWSPVGRRYIERLYPPSSHAPRGIFSLPASGGLLAAEEAEPAECASGGLRIPHFTLQIPF